MSRGDRLFRLLLWLYPRDFRASYGRAMLDFHRDRIRAARAAGESLALLWLLTLADTLRSAASEWLRPFTSGDSMLDTIAQDVKYAVRGFVRRPAFTAIVLATIALGIGANAAIFSVVNGILIRPLPYPHAERVFLFGHEPPHWLTSQPDFIDYHAGMPSLDGLAAYIRGDATLSGGAEPERIRLASGSDDFFPLLGVKPIVGRVFSTDEFAVQRPTVAIISYGLFQRRFGGSKSALGTTVSINGVPRTIVGVMPPHFDFPEARTDLWMPLPRFNPDSLGDRTNHYLFMVGRVKPTATIGRARVEAATIAHRIMQQYADRFDPKYPLIPRIRSVADELVGSTQPYLLALLGAAGFVLLIACSNVANLLLVRGEARQKEMALRSALGASGSRLAGQMLVESALLAIVGGALGLAFAWMGTRLLLGAAPSSIPRLDAIGIDWRVLLFTAGVVVATGLMIGLVPAWRIARGASAEALKESGRVVSTHGATRRVRRSLVVAEVALAVTTLSGAGMLLRSLWHLQGENLGFDPRGVLTAKVALLQREYDDRRTAVFYSQLESRLSALPGVRAAGASGWLPVVDAGGLWGFRPENGNYPEGRWPSAVPQQATPGYFAAAGLPLIAGRVFTNADVDGAPLVAVVSKAFADLAWPGQNAIGRRFGLATDMPFMTVVGIVGDIRARGFGDTPEPTMFFPFAQSAKSAYYMPRNMALLVRTSGDPALLAAAVRREIHALDPTVPVAEVRTLEEVAGTSVSSRRFNTSLLAGFAALALLLAGIGTYGVISYGVTQRTFEIGVRIALGADTRSVLGLIMAEGMLLAGTGLLLGLGASIAVDRFLRAMLVGVAALDPPSMIATAAALIAVAGVASGLPARRALRVNPINALRGS